MKRMQFDAQGRIASVDNRALSDFAQPEPNEVEQEALRTSESLSFLTRKEEVAIKDSSNWQLYEDGKKLAPLRFSNGKTQEDVVEEVAALIRSGKKIVFIHGMCGTGKSAIALHIIRELGKGCIVVPVKALQKQYEEDYMGKKYLFTKEGSKMKIAMITGRNNHDSLIKPGVSCADPLLPETVLFSEKNADLLKRYYYENPYISTTVAPDVRKLRRISVAPANPYWSPILPRDFELTQLSDARKMYYRGLSGKDFVFYHRKPGCSYYDQYLAYSTADAIIFNAAKYKIEVALDRKPLTDVDIIDEADEFLDSFSTQEELNLTKLASALGTIASDYPRVRESIALVEALLKLEEQNKRALGVDEDQIFPIHETKLEKLLKVFIDNPQLESEVVVDEFNYANTALEVARTLDGLFAHTYVRYRRVEGELYADFVNTNLSARFAEMVEKNKAMVLMSGTLHAPEVLREMFGITDVAIIEAETLTQGAVEIIRTGKEFDCRRANFDSKQFSRETYLRALAACIEKAPRPTLVHVNAYEDLPSEYEAGAYGVVKVMYKERLHELQSRDKTGTLISLFKSKLNDLLFSTKCSRGVDFPGEICNAIIFTKYPNPNAGDIFWKVLKKTQPHVYWDFYRDKARREFLQRIFRALRSKDDHVYVLSPDIRVLDAVQKLQHSTLENEIR